MASDDQNNSQRCFLDWMNLQELDLAELLQTLSDKPENVVLSQLAEKNIKHFQDYMDKRTELATKDVSAFFAPTWNSSLENSLLWVGGCRPSMFIRLTYALCGSQFESQLEEYLAGVRTGDLSELSPRQLVMVNDLHRNTINQEEKLTNRFASLQEDIADDPICVIARDQNQPGEPNEDVARALQDHDKAMVGILQEADNLRLSTLKELISILTPVQAVDYLASGKKLHLCMHEWGKQRDRLHGRSN